MFRNGGRHSQTRIVRGERLGINSLGFVRPLQGLKIKRIEIDRGMRCIHEHGWLADETVKHFTDRCQSRRVSL